MKNKLNILIKQKAIECHVDGFVHEPFEIPSFNEIIKQHDVC